MAFMQTAVQGLAENGEIETVYKMLTQPECPGYAYWIRQGMTSLCEQWDTSKSRNHVACGDFSACFFRYFAGFRHIPDYPGWQNLEIRPVIR